MIGIAPHLKALRDRKIVWDYSAVSAIKHAGELGLAEYVTGFHCGYWVLTEKGVDFLRNVK